LKNNVVLYIISFTIKEIKKMFTIYTSHNNKKGNSRAAISDVVSINNPFNIFNQKLKNRVKTYLDNINRYCNNMLSYCDNIHRYCRSIHRYCNNIHRYCNNIHRSCDNMHRSCNNIHRYCRNIHRYCNNIRVYCSKKRRLTFIIPDYHISIQTYIFKNKGSIYQTILSIYNMKYFIQNTEINLQDLKKCFKKCNTYLSNYETITVIGK